MSHVSSTPPATVEAAVLSLALGGGSPTARAPATPVPIVRHIESPWRSRVDAIASFLGKDVAELVSDPRVAREAAVLWQVSAAR